MSGEGIQTIDFLILTREVGFSPTFLKRGSNLVSATIYIYTYMVPQISTVGVVIDSGISGN